MDRETYLDDLRTTLGQKCRLKVTKPDGSFDLMAIEVLEHQGKTLLDV